MSSAGTEVTRLVALTLLGAGLLVVHVLLLIRTARSEKLKLPLRALAWLPPATPVIGFIGGARVLSIAWVVQAVAYAMVRAGFT